MPLAQLRRPAQIAAPLKAQQQITTGMMPLVLLPRPAQIAAPQKAQQQTTTGITPPARHLRPAQNAAPQKELHWRTPMENGEEGSRMLLVSGSAAAAVAFAATCTQNRQKAPLYGRISVLPALPMAPP